MALHRHQLVQLSDEGWRLVCEQIEDGPVGDCLRHWAEHRLPLVVTRQRCANVPQVDDHIALGLAAPAQWQRRRISISVPRIHVIGFTEFPRLDSLSWAWPTLLGPKWRNLLDQLAPLDTPTHVYGSWGWQLSTGLPYVHERSDVDLWFAVNDAKHADHVAEALDRHGQDENPRIDGELVFPDGAAVAWREWLAYRAGRSRAFLAKTLDGAMLRTVWG